MWFCSWGVRVVQLPMGTFPNHFYRFCVSVLVTNKICLLFVKLFFLSDDNFSMLNIEIFLFLFDIAVNRE